MPFYKELITSLEPIALSDKYFFFCYLYSFGLKNQAKIYNYKPNKNEISKYFVLIFGIGLRFQPLCFF